MSSVVDVSSRLGEYMLKGWVLTDKSCPTPGCRVPLMRSPNGQSPVTWFCANCDGSPSQPQSSTSTSEAPSNEHPSPSFTSSTHLSRPSTPPTEVSSALSSPTFAPPVETEESIRRRHQSDIASAEIGKRLLKGWAMLADECPGATCYGVPLVRPPRAGGEKDPRKECIVCGTIYVDDPGARGFARLVPMNAPSSQLNEARLPDSGAGPSTAGISQSKGKAVVRDDTPTTGSSSLPVIQIPSPVKSRRSYFSSDLARANGPASSGDEFESTLQTSVKSLEFALSTLSERLTNVSGQAILDPSSISHTAEAIGRVAQALSHVRQLQRESQIYPS